MIDWMLAGFPKCGTTWLASMLQQHPDLSIQTGGPTEEVQYFATEYYYRKGMNWYESQFPEPEGRLVGDYSARYCQVDYCKLSYHQLDPPRLIHERFGNIPLIFAVRDPIDRMESQINHWIDNGTFPEDVTMDKLMGQEHGLDRQILLLNMGRYWNSIRQFLDWWSEGQIHVHVFETHTVENPPEGLVRTVRFLLGHNLGDWPAKGLHDAKNAREHQLVIPDEWRDRLRDFYGKDTELLFDWLDRDIPEDWL